MADLTEDNKGYVLNLAGFYLRSLGRLTEAVEPMRASLDVDIAQEDWNSAAVDAANHSELFITMGDLAQALNYAEQGVELADRSRDEFQRFLRRTDLGHVLHQADRIDEAESLFREAEAMQKEIQREFQFLYSVQGFQYCDLLLEQGRHQEVQERASRTLEWAEQAGASLLTIALDHLSLGRAHLAEAQEQGTGDFSKATEHLDRAVDGLRQAGYQDDLPRGLLTRGALHRLKGDFDLGRRDLDEAMVIAERGGMGLHQADAHLEYARLYLAMGDKPQAREHWATAKEMVEEMGYHRRDEEVAELAEQFEAT